MSQNVDRPGLFPLHGKETITFRFIVYFVGPLALLFSLHGAVGYTNFVLLKLFGFALLSLVWLYLFVKHGARLNKYILLYLFFLLAFCLYAVFKEPLVYNSSDGFQFVVINIICLMLLYSASNGSGFTSGFILLWASLFISVVALYLYFFPTQIAGLQFGVAGSSRMIGPFSTPNRFAEAPAVGAIISLFLYFYYNKKSLLLLCLFLILITVMSGSKGVLVSLLVSLIVGAKVFRSAASFKRFIYFSLSIFLVIGVAVYAGLDFMKSTRMDIVIDGERDLTSGRLNIWQQVMTSFADTDGISALFGHGVNGFYNLHGVNPHSTFFLLLFDYGVLLLTFYVVFTIWVGRRLYRNVDAHSRLFLVLLIFSFVRGVSMPNFMVTISFSMLAYWAALGWVFSRR